MIVQVVGCVCEVCVSVFISQVVLLLQLKGLGFVIWQGGFGGSQFVGGVGGVFVGVLSFMLGLGMIIILVVQVDVLWEIDFFGGKCCSLEGVDVCLIVSEVDWYDVCVLFVVEVVNVYLQ